MTDTKPMIAVVDDEWSVRVMLGRVLRLGGYRVAAFARGDDFMSSLETRHPACAILDIHMAQMSGFQVQAQLLRAGTGMPVILITASDDATLDDAARIMKATCLLRKPFSADTLLEAVARALALPGGGT